MKDSRPETLSLGVKFGVESDMQDESSQILRLEP